MIVAVNKPLGWTSFDVVKKVRSISGERKVGHAGTLDPFAEGVMVLGIGRRGTRELGGLSVLDKEYEACLKLGVETDTLDPEGKIVRRRSVPELTDRIVEDVFGQFTGVIEQTPPMYSAKRMGGIRLYELARRNIEVKRTPVDVEIKSLILISLWGQFVEFSVACSKGTYIRQLGADIACALGTVGHLVSLKRVRVGQFTLDDCRSLEDLSQEWLSIAD